MNDVTVTHRGHVAKILERGVCGWVGCMHGQACVLLELADGRKVNAHAKTVYVDGKPLELPGQLSILDVA